MKLKYDMFIWNNGKITFNRIIEITESDIEEFLQNKFKEGEFPCPIHLDRETVKVEFSLNSIES